MRELFISKLEAIANDPTSIIEYLIFWLVKNAKK